MSSNDFRSLESKVAEYEAVVQKYDAVKTQHQQSKGVLPMFGQKQNEAPGLGSDLGLNQKVDHEQDVTPDNPEAGPKRNDPFKP